MPALSMCFDKGCVGTCVRADNHVYRILETTTTFQSVRLESSKEWSCTDVGMTFISSYHLRSPSEKGSVVTRPSMRQLLVPARLHPHLCHQPLVGSRVNTICSLFLAINGPGRAVVVVGVSPPDKGVRRHGSEPTVPYLSMRVLRMLGEGHLTDTTNKPDSPGRSLFTASIPNGEVALDLR